MSPTSYRAAPPRVRNTNRNTQIPRGQRSHASSVFPQLALAVQASSAAAARLNERVEACRKAVARLTKKGPMATILLVEDNDDVREMMAVALELGGHSVTSAPNGRVALELLTKGMRPSLIVLDLMMPVMNGWELCRVLKANPRLSEIPVVVVSAVTSDAAQRLAGRQFVPKPVDISYLLNVVEEQIGARLTGSA
jgi:CheY-like chemotaxis protein